MTDANNGIAFSMTKEEENNKKSKKKEITCYKFKKTGHYVNECDEEGTVKTSNKKGSNFLVLKMTNMRAAQMKKVMTMLKAITTASYT